MAVLVSPFAYLDRELLGYPLIYNHLEGYP
jgi:hypothetical protein